MFLRIYSQVFVLSVDLKWVYVTIIHLLCTRIFCAKNVFRNTSYPYSHISYMKPHTYAHNKHHNKTLLHGIWFIAFCRTPSTPYTPPRTVFDLNKRNSPVWVWVVNVIRTMLLFGINFVRENAVKHDGVGLFGQIWSFEWAEIRGELWVGFGLFNWIEMVRIYCCDICEVWGNIICHNCCGFSLLH